MLEIRPCDYADSKAFVKEYHRHNKPPAGHKFSIACFDVGGARKGCAALRWLADLLEGFLMTD